MEVVQYGAIGFTELISKERGPHLIWDKTSRLSFTGTVEKYNLWVFVLVRKD